MEASKFRTGEQLDQPKLILGYRPVVSLRGSRLVASRTSAAKQGKRGAQTDTQRGRKMQCNAFKSQHKKTSAERRQGRETGSDETNRQTTNRIDSHTGTRQSGKALVELADI